ncbi:hypothetical protein INT43_003978 [Umbelopsis isabellina]|uniref:Structural maintenance of chromosomes protein n=1 Tax=Mortierella isabellina TaxID=91625 RepID=A0A8H7UID5_MORIS|nr:hypothetical protein INT43_003978 [Umbelopsis isabellina]
MFVEELIIEGFKSYVSRTHVTGWDPEFNAITGLNGSGKSNILDAICFVLGITNLSQVRASTLQDLIYKRGQAGVTKASVTIVFNNEDRAKSPVGFEAYKQLTVTRQVLMGGRTKYIVNGHNAQQQTVQNLFQSVQLNINNPHFLIMQGRITKVLNMKPAEILSMIEEAAGTKMFEDRKAKAFATMAKKEKKVEEINKILQEDIMPKLDKLRGEKRTYLDYQKNESEMERLNRLVVAAEYDRHAKKLDRSNADNDERKAKLDELQRLVEERNTEIAAIEDERHISTVKKQEQSEGGKNSNLEAAVQEAATSLVRLKTQVDLKNASIIDEEKNLSALQSTYKENDQAQAERKTQFDKLNALFGPLKQEFDRKTKEMQKTSELVQALTTGVSAQEGQENGYMEQLQDAKNTASRASTIEDQARLKIKHLEKDLEDKEAQANKTERQNKGLQNEIAAGLKAKSDLTRQLQSLKWDANSETQLLQQQKDTQRTISDLKDKAENLSRRLSNLDFVYTNPTPTFDRSKVKGLVAELITLDKSRFDSSTALEICAGGRLYNVVVENEIVGSQLLDKGQLRRRWTLIPLNKIQAFKASAERVATAQRMAPGKVELALTLVGYDKQVQTAMEWVFGNTLICKDAESAKRVTFDKNVRMKSVTVDGDVYDPFGTLSGGSKPNSAGILVKVQELNTIRQEIKQHQSILLNIEQELTNSKRIIMDYNQRKKMLDLKTHEMHLLEEQLRQSTHSQLVAQVAAIKEELQTQEKSIVNARRQRKEALEECERIEQEMTEFNRDKKSKLKEMQQKIASLKADIAKDSAKIKNMQRDVQTLQMEIEQTDTDANAARTEIAQLQETIEEYKKECSTANTEMQKLTLRHNELKAELQTHQAKLTEINKELERLDSEHKKIMEEVTEANLELQKLTHEYEKYQKEQNNSQQILRDLEHNHDWIVDQKSLFGQPDTPYDYRDVNLADAKKTLQQLVDKHEAMRKKINVKVMNMIDNVEKKEAGLKQMLITVQKDKQKIEDTIVSLDNYKKEALAATWEKVNKDFGDIFGELLAGNTAKLQPPEGKTISDGLEVKVCLGGVWKQSLTELSGGQRSLIALSLILSLLQFKPAPMYILDEVDAALDLSHTQNIGHLLRSRFKGSQFIVVSLKDGMFNNANVLFKTRFRDGTSIVERTSNRQSNKENETTSSPANRSKRGRDGARATARA